MKKYLPRSISAKYLFVLICGMATIFLILSILAAKKNISEIEKSIAKRIEEVSFIVEAAITIPLWQFNNSFIINFTNSLALQNDIIHVSVRGNEGSIYEITDARFKGKSFASFSNSSVFESITIPITYNNQNIGTVQMILDRNYIARFFIANNIYALTGILTILLTAIAISICFIRLIVTRPLQTLERYAVTVAQGNLDKEIDVSSKDELGSLAKNINSMRLSFKNLIEETQKADNLKSINKKLQIEILERHQAEKLLRKSQERFQYVLNYSTDTLYNINLQNGSYEYISPSCVITCGYTQEELRKLGLKGSAPLFHPDDTQRLKEHFLNHLSEEGTSPVSSVVEYRFKHKVLGYRHISDTRTIIFDNEKKPISIIGSARDITEAKNIALEKEKLQTKLHQSQKMEAIGTLAGGIAHDFNNILGAILGYADIAKDDVVPGSSIDEDLTEIIHAGDRAKELVRQILSFSRKEAQQHRNVSIIPIIKETVKLLRASIPANIHIDVDIDQECGNIMAEPTQIHQVLMNLCANAAHVTELSGGNIRITLSRIEKDELNLKDMPISPAEKYIALQVIDNGPGIDTDILDKVFDPYFTTKEVGKGSGMGLTVVSGIVKGHGGAISVESNHKDGTTFSVIFPEVEKDTTQEVLPDRSLKEGYGRILLIDDEVAIVDMTRRRLEKLGYKVTALSNSREGLQTFSDSPDSFDLVITDLTMPDITGDQLAAKIIAVRPAMPIIMCSGYNARIDEKIAEKIGIKSFLMKPVDKYELSDTIDRLLRKKNDQLQNNNLFL